MDKQEYFRQQEEFFKSCIELSKRKNEDYTGDSDDPFSNFKSIEVLGIPAEIGFLTRMMDKMRRISSFVNKGEFKVKDESIRDTLIDLANYTSQLALYIKSHDKEIY